MKTRLLGGIAALLVAIIGTVLLVNYVQNADKRAMAGTETESVYVVEKTISAGTGIDKAAGAVVRKDIPKAAVAAGAVTDLNQVGQKGAAVDLMPGEQLLATRMVDADSILGPARVQVPTGMQEITLKLPIERVVGGTLTAGDTVGVFLSVDDSAAKSGGTQLTFHKVLVTAAQFSNGSTATSQEDAAQEDSSKGTLTTKKSTSANGTYLITLARNAADAEKV